MIEQDNDKEENDSEEDLLLDEMKNAGIDEVSAPELKQQLQQYLLRLKISESEEDYDDDLLAFDNILLDAYDDENRPPSTSSSSSRSISEQIRLNSLRDDSEDDDHDGDYYHDDNVYSKNDDIDYDNDDYDGNKRVSDSHGYDSNSSTDDDEYDEDDDEDDDDDDMVIDDDDEVVEYNDDDNDDGDNDDDINIDVNEESMTALIEAYAKTKVKDEKSDDIYLTEVEWQDILARYKKPAVTELEKERERVYSMFEDYDVEKAEMIEDLERFKQMRSDEDDDIYDDSNDDDIYGDGNDDDSYDSDSDDVMIIMIVMMMNMIIIMMIVMMMIVMMMMM